MPRRATLFFLLTASLGAAACDEVSTAETARELQCGPTLDFTPVNAYQGELAAARDREDAVVLINGNCSGTLIAARAGPVVLTAGHCVALGDRALVVFNFEDQPDGDPLITEGTVIEQASAPDYALLLLDALPALSPTALTTHASDRLAIVQHPRGRPKVVAEGSFVSATEGVVRYADLDTLIGSSGAGVLTREGRLLAVHSEGDCTEDGQGANTGWSAASIVGASAYLQSDDIDGC
ncbi:MAG: serine protease [Polyangiaceae bacterium]|jgi:hypothetical protein|nr:serine protease [Polyangiaceae bacterium]